MVPSPRTETQRRNAMKRAARRRQAELNRMAYVEMASVRLSYGHIPKQSAGVRYKPSTSPVVPGPAIERRRLTAEIQQPHRPRTSKRVTSVSGQPTIPADRWFELDSVFGDVSPDPSVWRSVPAKKINRPSSSRPAPTSASNNNNTTGPRTPLRELYDRAKERIRESRVRDLSNPSVSRVRTQHLTPERIASASHGVRTGSRIIRGIQNLIDASSQVAMYVQGSYILRWGSLRGVYELLREFTEHPTLGLQLSLGLMCYSLSFASEVPFTVPFILTLIRTSNLVSGVFASVRMSYESVALAWNSVEASPVFQRALASMERFGANGVWHGLLPVVRSSLHDLARPVLESLLEIVAAFVPGFGLAMELYDLVRSAHSLLRVLRDRYLIHVDLVRIYRSYGSGVHTSAPGAGQRYPISQRKRRLIAIAPSYRNLGDNDTLAMVEQVDIFARVFRDQLATCLSRSHDDNSIWSTANMTFLTDFFRTRNRVVVPTGRTVVPTLLQIERDGSGQPLPTPKTTNQPATARIEELPDVDARHVFLTMKDAEEAMKQSGRWYPTGPRDWYYPDHAGMMMSCYWPEFPRARKPA